MKDSKTDERTPEQRALSRTITEIHSKVEGLKVIRKDRGAAWVYAITYFNQLAGFQIPEHLNGWHSLFTAVQEFWPTVNQDVGAIYERFREEARRNGVIEHPLLA